MFPTSDEFAFGESGAAEILGEITSRLGKTTEQLGLNFSERSFAMPSPPTRLNASECFGVEEGSRSIFFVGGSVNCGSSSSSNITACRLSMKKLMLPEISAQGTERKNEIKRFHYIQLTSIFTTLFAEVQSKSNRNTLFSQCCKEVPLLQQNSLV